MVSRIKIDFAFYKLTRDLENFKMKWGINNTLCEVSEEEELLLNV